MRHIFLYSEAHWKKIALFIDALCNTEAKRTHIPQSNGTMLVMHKSVCVNIR